MIEKKYTNQEFSFVCDIWGGKSLFYRDMRDGRDGSDASGIKKNMHLAMLLCPKFKNTF